jgi:phosphoglycolate phosphatase
MNAAASTTALRSDHAARFETSCVLFDLDGTLIDTAPDLGYAANQVRIEVGLDPLPLEDYRTSASGGARGLLKVALGITPESAGYSVLKDRFLVHYRDHLTHESRLFPGVAELLRSLDKAGIPWGIVTNKVASLAAPLVGALKLSERSACLISGDSTPNPKPAPDPLLLACQKIGVAPGDCVYVGDDERDIVAGRAARMATIAAEWGYLGVGAEVKAWGADVIVTSPVEIVELIRLRRAA